MKTIHIIGGGPVGSYSAYLFAKQGYNVRVYEEHQDIGKPIQCTGILSSEIYTLINKKSLEQSGAIVNKIKRANIYSPNSLYVPVSFSKENIVLDRELFDIHISNKALRKGVRYLLGHRLLTISKKNERIYLIFQTQTERIRIKLKKGDVLVGADGPLSLVRSFINPPQKVSYKHKPLVTGIQSRVKFNNYNVVQYYPFINNYAWFVPENNTEGRLGTVGKHISLLDFERFKEFSVGRLAKHIEFISGVIPVFSIKLSFSKKTKHNTIAIVGDAAGFVKETTGGGIIPGFIGAQALVRSIKTNTSYKKNLNRMLFPKLLLHKYIARTLKKLTHQEWNVLIKLLSKSSVRKILETTNRDRIFTLAIRLVLAEHKLLRFCFILFR